MPPQSRGPQKPLPAPAGFQSKSTPNLPTLKSLTTANNAEPTPKAYPSNLHPAHPTSPDTITSPSEAASIEDFSLDGSHEPSSLSPTSSESEEEDASEEDDVPAPNLPPRPYHHHHYSRSHTYLGPSAFAPPFYGRPPTPLPPSPSLTSLLRPNFSSQNSRPTTPDPSSDEGGTPQIRGGGGGTGTQTPNSAAVSTLTSSFRTAKPIPRASPQVPTYEYYGFTLYLTSSLAFVVYLLWSFLPSPFLHSLGIYYYPNRWWALAIPAWTVMLMVYIYVALASYNTEYLTLPMDSVECLVDEAANVAVVDAEGKIIRDDRPSWRSPSPDGKGSGNAVGKRNGRGQHGGQSRHASQNRHASQSRQASVTRAPTNGNQLDWRTLWTEGTDAVMDIPIGGVCEILYGGGQWKSDDGRATSSSYD